VAGDGVVRGNRVLNLVDRDTVGRKRAVPVRLGRSTARIFAFPASPAFQRGEMLLAVSRRRGRRAPRSARQQRRQYDGEAGHCQNSGYPP
jgi:hypothetical protein